MAQPHPSTPVRWLTTAQVASIFRVGAVTVTRWAMDGKLTSIRTPGGHRHYNADQVARLLTSLTCEAVGQDTRPHSP
ncbi:MAG: hypothetical protein QOD10_4507 [Mycobacterium sp.]|nr:hypothetical protein [Mycobacterium sp.]